MPSAGREARFGGSQRVARRGGDPVVTASPQQSSIRVLIADDQRVVRDGLSMLVALIDGIQVVGAASDGSEALAMAEAHHADVVLMDLRMPGLNGIAATGQPPAHPGSPGPGVDHLRRRRYDPARAARRLPARCCHVQIGAGGLIILVFLIKNCSPCAV
jgi:CheY-like chemotaxis protein